MRRTFAIRNTYGPLGGLQFTAQDSLVLEVLEDDVSEEAGQEDGLKQGQHIELGSTRGPERL